MCCFPFQIEEDREKFNSKNTSDFVDVVVLIKCKTKEVLLRGERIQSQFFHCVCFLIAVKLKFRIRFTWIKVIIRFVKQVTVNCDIYSFCKTHTSQRKITQLYCKVLKTNIERYTSESHLKGERPVDKKKKQTNKSKMFEFKQTRTILESNLTCDEIFYSISKLPK